MPYANTGSDNGLLPDGTKPLPEPFYIASCSRSKNGFIGSYEIQINGLVSPNKSATKGLDVYTQWGRDKMAIIFQTKFSNAFSWMEMFEF